jgi:hypothetical protein
MDYVTRQFINLTKKLRKDFRKLLDSLSVDLHHIKNAIQAIDKNARANQQKEQSKIEVVALLHEPEGAEAKRKAEYNRTQRRDRVRLLVEWLTFFAVVFYGYMAVRQWREQISARHQTQHVLEAAQGSVVAAQQANTDAMSRFREDQRPYIWQISTLEKLNTKGSIGFEQPSATEPMTASVVYQNYGRSPAITTRYAGDVRVSNDPVKRLRAKQWRRLSTVVPPGRTDVISVDSEGSEKATAQEITAVNDPRGAPVVAAALIRIQYRDVSGHLYESDMCFYTPDGIKKMAAYCPASSHLTKIIDCEKDPCEQ